MVYKCHFCGYTGSLQGFKQHCTGRKHYKCGTCGLEMRGGDEIVFLGHLTIHYPGVLEKKLLIEENLKKLFG